MIDQLHSPLLPVPAVQFHRLWLSVVTELDGKDGESFQGQKGLDIAARIGDPLQQGREVMDQRWLLAKAKQQGLQGLFHRLLNLKAPAGFIDGRDLQNLGCFEIAASNPEQCLSLRAGNAAAVLPGRPSRSRG